MTKKYQRNLYSSAFSMIELVFVIVVIGILAATIIPQTKTNPLQEAAIQLASHIKYTQHLAMIDDRYDATNLDSANAVKWYKERWQLVFTSSIYSGGSEAYTIFSDYIGDSTGDVDANETAKNPENSNQLMTGGYSNTAALDYTDPDFEGMKKLNIGDTYGVTSVLLGGGCRADWKRISFDHLGRPFQGRQSSMTSPYNIGSTQRLIQSVCTVTLSDGSDSAVINIEPETGYVWTTF